ncbi:MAG: hypothetical protein E6X17_06095 [Sporomusaceae bacterium]|nr:hypothetical protein [Sporomusaceae bacterium]
MLKKVIAGLQWIDAIVCSPDFRRGLAIGAAVGTVAAVLLLAVVLR